MKLTPAIAKFCLNLYPPYLGAGVRIAMIRPDWREMRIEMKLHWYNRNAVGTHFGGSLYSMIDPHLMLMLMMLLGREYVIWDKAATIDFVKPGLGTVSSIITVSDDDLRLIREKTANGDKYLPEFNVRIENEAGELVADVKKVIYIRKKRPD